MVTKFLVVSALASAACALAAAAHVRGTASAAGREVSVKWFGHACFLITSPEGVKILMDPFDATVGYAVPSVDADVVTASHDHFDHNNVSMARGKPVVLKGKGEYRGRDVSIRSVASFHDAEGGAKRGKNAIFVVDAAGLRIVHMGDIGHDLSKSQLEEIGKVDVLLVPVGGTYTIDAAGAKRLVEATSPMAVIPMHYKTPAVGMPIAGVDQFLTGYARVVKVGSNEVKLSAERKSPGTTVYVLEAE